MNRPEVQRDNSFQFFSFQGDLPHVEYAFKAIDNEKITSVALKSGNCAVVATQKKQIANVVPESTLQLFGLTRNIGCVMTGRVSDSRHLMAKAQYEAAQFHTTYSYEIPVDVLCNRVGDLIQVATQYNSERPLASDMIIIGYDEEFGPMVYKTDPTGNVCSYRACAAGLKKDEVTAYLECNYEDNLSEKRTIQLAIDCLESISDEYLKPTDIDVGIVSITNHRFRIFKVEEIATYLNKYNVRGKSNPNSCDDHEMDCDDDEMDCGF